MQCTLKNLNIIILFEGPGSDRGQPTGRTATVHRLHRILRGPEETAADWLAVQPTAGSQPEDCVYPIPGRGCHNDFAKDL